MKIEQSISTAIKSSNWLSIEYVNQDEKITKYWVAIKEIDCKKKSFFVNAFNVSKVSNESQGLIETWISFEKIKNAFVIENTTYEQPLSLLATINSNDCELDWLSYDFYNDDILDYIHECMKHEEVAYQTQTTLIKGIDQNKLETLPFEKKYVLNHEQISDLVPKLERLSKQDQSQVYETVILALNYLSISTRKGLFVVAYRELKFNPIEKALILSSDTMFNYDFASNELKDFRHNLRNYLDIETDEFTEMFITNPTEAKNALGNEVKKYKESLDDRPYVFELRRSYFGHILKEINQMKAYKSQNQLSVPLEAFFGNMSKDKLKRKKQVDVVIFDNKANIDQLRVIYNALVQPITYVQGPPGTGKTATIINLLISAFFNNQTVLVSSNNNKPITDIFNKLQTLKSRDRQIPLPFLRLGNSDEVIKSLDYLAEVLSKYRNFQNDDSKLEVHALNKKERMKQINALLERYEIYIELSEEIDALRSIKSQLNADFRSDIVISTLLDEKEKSLSQLPEVHESDIRSLLTKADQSFLTWLFFTSVKHIKKINEPQNEQLLNIINSKDNEERVKLFNNYTSNEENFKNLLRIFPIILSTNQSAYKLGPQKQSFNLVILDEAGQCSIGPSLFSISRGERLLLVGDQNQLKPVISIAPETNKVLIKKYKITPAYDYLYNSILLTMQKMDTISKFVLLSYHYRSRKDIIGFSNAKYYHGQLKLVMEDLLTTPALEFINVDTSKTSRQSEKNISPMEISEIIQSIEKSQETNIGVITPFRNQAAMLKDALFMAGYSNIDVGTIHTFQGDEKDVIYLSSGITKHTYDKTYDWVKNNQELINVATTRAKKKFVLATDFKEIEKRSKVSNDFSELCHYVKNNGKEVHLTKSTQTKFINGANFKNYNTNKENEFFETINHLLTMGSKYIVKQKVRVASILDTFTSPIKHDYGLKAEFDMVVFKKINNLEIPVLVVELDGDEHSHDIEVIKRDKLKEEICKDNNVQIIHIQNDYSRRYMHIKEIFMTLLK